MRKMLTAAAVVVLLLNATSAYAATTGDQTQTPGTSVTRQTWDATATTVRLRVTPSAADAGTSDDGTCVDSIFDWQTSAGQHYDARVVRVCEDTVLRSWTFTEDPAAPLVGEQKARGCLVTGTAANGTGGSRSGCEAYVGTNVGSCGSYAVSCVVRLNGVWRTYPATNDPTSPTS